MRITIVCPDIYPALFGNSKLAWEFAKKLSNHGFEIIAVTNGDRVEVQEISNIQICHIPMNKFWYAREIPPKIQHLMKGFDSDIIHGFGLFSAFMTTKCKKELMRPTIQSVTGVWPVFKLGGISMPLPKVCKTLPLSRIDTLTFTNSYTQQYFTQTPSCAILRRKRNLVIPFGIEDVWYSTNTLKEMDNQKILFFGDGTYERGLSVVLDAIPTILKKHNVEITLAIRHWGDNSKRSLISRTKNVLKQYPHNVTLIEYPMPYHISELVRQNSIVLLPFTVNSMEPPVSLVESMALGKAVITTNIGGNRELIGRNQRGILIDPGDVSQLVNSVTYLIENESEIHTLGKQAKTFIQTNYNWTRAVQLLTTTYEESLCT